MLDPASSLRIQYEHTQTQRKENATDVTPDRTFFRKFVPKADLEN